MAEQVEIYGGVMWDHLSSSLFPHPGRQEDRWVWTGPYPAALGYHGNYSSPRSALPSRNHARTKTYS